MPELPVIHCTRVELHYKLFLQANLTSGIRTVDLIVQGLLLRGPMAPYNFDACLDALNLISQSDHLYEMSLPSRACRYVSIIQKTTVHHDNVAWPWTVPNLVTL